MEAASLLALLRPVIYVGEHAAVGAIFYNDSDLRRICGPDRECVVNLGRWMRVREHYRCCVWCRVYHGGSLTFSHS